MSRWNLAPDKQQGLWPVVSKQSLLRLSAPHAAHAGTDIDTRTLACRMGRGSDRWQGPGCLFEQIEQSVGNEARPGCINMAIALRILAVRQIGLNPAFTIH